MRAGVAAILGESVRSAAVRELCAVIKKEESVLSKLRKCRRNPVILIVDKVGCTHRHTHSHSYISWSLVHYFSGRIC